MSPDASLALGTCGGCLSSPHTRERPSLRCCSCCLDGGLVAADAWATEGAILDADRPFGSRACNGEAKGEALEKHKHGVYLTSRRASVGPGAALQPTPLTWWTLLFSSRMVA